MYTISLSILIGSCESIAAMPTLLPLLVSTKGLVKSGYCMTGSFIFGREMNFHSLSLWNTFLKCTKCYWSDAHPDILRKTHSIAFMRLNGNLTNSRRFWDIFWLHFNRVESSDPSLFRNYANRGRLCGVTGSYYSLIWHGPNLFLFGFVISNSRMRLRTLVAILHT